jgi:PPP family 3-phenylpropionic acid transporter
VALTLAYSLFWSSAVPLCEGFSVRACRLKSDIDYGRMRLFGSATFVISGFACGFLIEHFGADIFPYYIIFWCMVAIAWSFFMPNIYQLERQNNLELPSANLEVIKSLLFNKDFLFVIFGAGVMHSGHALLFQAGAIDWIAAGFKELHISLFFAIGVLAEILIFRFSTNLEKNISTAGFFIIAGIASFIRWFGMAQNPSFELIIILQVLHGFTFGILHLGCIRYFKTHLRSGTLGAAQLIYGGVLWGAAMIPATFIAGYFHEQYGLKAYYVMALLAILGTGIIFMANNLFEKNNKRVENFCK